MSGSLFALVNNYNNLMDQFDKAMGEFTEESEEMLQVISEALAKKSDNVVTWFYYLDNEMERINSELYTLESKLEKILKARNKFSEYVSDCIEAMGTNRIEGDQYEITRIKPRTIVEIADKDSVDASYLNTKVKKETTIDKKSIKEDIENGKTVSGARLALGKKTVKYKRR